MVLNIWNDIWSKLNEWGEAFKDFIVEQSRNPFLWVIIVIIGLIVFEYLYKKLHKD